uniref:Cadherin domain-containing protein n=1 Tax=Biomphalaria glabrata TaxID=6526 RepID=A0A2C9KUC1_BIOGL
MFLLASITLLILRSTTVLSQSNACGTESTIVVRFPESLSSQATPFSVDFIQTLLNGQPANVVVNSDPIDRFTTQFYPINDYFTISYNTIVKAMQIRMIKGIDRDGTTSSTEDDVNILQYQLVCYPDVSSVASNSAIFKVLKIQIVDVNDNAPIFVNAPYSISVNELTPVGMTVFRGISATDLDEGPNKQIFYSLSVGTSQFNFNGTAYFNLPSEQDGILAVLNAIDFESMYRVTRDASLTYFNLTITARDNASPTSAQKSTQTSIKILITDSDDQGPEFVYPSCIQNKLSNSNSCVRAKYSTSITSGNASLIYPLDLMPEPRDVTNSTAKVTILMQDRDNLNSSLICRIIRTEPPGYESYFGTTSALYRSNTKQYRCDIEKSGGRIVYRSNTSSIELIIEVIVSDFFI